METLESVPGERWALLVACKDDWEKDEYEGIRRELERECKPTGQESHWRYVDAIHKSGALVKLRAEFNSGANPRVIIALRLIPESGSDEDANRWYYRQFHAWRSAVKPQKDLACIKNNPGTSFKGLGFINPFDRGLQTVLGIYDGSKFSIGADFSGADPIYPYTLLRHYQGYSEVELDHNNVCKKFHLMSELVKRYCSLRLKYPEPAQTSVDVLEPITVHIDKPLAECEAIRSLIDALVSIEVLRVPRTQGSSEVYEPGAGDLGKICKVTFKIHELDESAVASALAEGSVCVLADGRDKRDLITRTATAPREARGVFGFRTADAPRNSPRNVVLVKLNDENEQVQFDQRYLISPPNMFVLWDCIWEAVFEAAQEKTNQKKRSPARPEGGDITGSRRLGSESG